MNFARIWCSLVLAVSASLAHSEIIHGLTFARQPGVVYVPLRETATALGWLVHWDSSTRSVLVADKKVDSDSFKLLFDGTKLLPVREFEKLGATLQLGSNDTATLRSGSAVVEVVEAAKHVEVSISEQTLRAWQGDTLVMETNISSGRRGHSTPQGKFKAGPVKDRMHYSRLYNNSPMPYSVQINGNVFIHGYHSVPPRPASHGCIRMPLRHKNAAKYFFDWVDIGTPVWVVSDFTDENTRLTAGR